MGQYLTYMRSKRTERISYEQLADDIFSSQYVVALTGAGASAESGIPTFRDPNDGLWQRFDLATYATIWGFWRSPEKIWELLHAFLSENDPQPNDAHRALVKLERMGKLKAIITQNVDSLHQDAGSRNVIEFHGNLMRATCWKCGHKIQLSRNMIKDLSFAANLPPECDCGGIYKPDAILFGEKIPSAARRAANAEAKRCDLLLVVGTTATVSPASDIPYAAMRNGARVIEVNLEPTGLTERISDKIVLGECSRLMRTSDIVAEKVAAEYTT